eukprot:2994129-Ditylum_brightwellii.AAC.2
MAAEAYNDPTVLKLLPEECVGKVEFVEHVVEPLAAIFSHIMQSEFDDSLIVQCDCHLRIFYT